LFDDKERQHLVKDFHNLETSNVSFKGRVTAFASSKSSKQRVYGMSDGTIYLYNERTGKTTKLEGHLSRISKLKLDRMSLYSSSYDGTLKLWNTGSEKIEPITLVSTNSWIMDFNFDSSKQYAWIGDQNGYLSEVLMSVPMMVEKINKKLTRNFTPEEWNYYIGKNVPYETFKK
jgi:WD40 repeat protein